MGTNRLAVFVEGQTEQKFMQKLIREIAGEANLRLQAMKAVGPSKRRSLQQQYTTPDFPGTRYDVLIVDSGGDETVVSDMLDQYESLVKRGYSRILGLRDVRPRWSRRDIPKLERAMEKAMKMRLPPSPLPVDVLLAVMEIEAWFIAEYSHLEKIGITCEAVKRELDFDPSTDDVELIDHPSVLLNQIYQLMGQSYKKKLRQVQGVVNRLDYARLYLGMREEVPRLGALFTAIDLFLDRK